MKADLTSYRLREIEILCALEKPVPREEVSDMAEVLQALLDEAQDAEEEHEHIGDLPGTIKRLEELRSGAVEATEEEEAKYDKKLEEARKEHETALEEEREKRLEMEKTCDEWKRRAEKAEHDLSAGVRHGHGIDQVTALRLRKMEAELVEAKTARVESAAAERAAAETNQRLQAQMDRAAAYWQEKAAGETERELSAVRGQLAEEARAKLVAEKSAAETLLQLKRIADGKPEDAHRSARLALGRDIIEKTGTAAKEAYIPTRAERKRARAAEK